MKWSRKTFQKTLWSGAKSQSHPLDYRHTTDVGEEQIPGPPQVRWAVFTRLRPVEERMEGDETY